MILKKTVTLQFLITIFFLTIGVETLLRFKGYKPLSSSTYQNSNRIFYGILNKCSKLPLNKKIKSNFPVKIFNEKCINNQPFSILNIIPNISRKFVTKEYSTTIITNEIGARLPNGNIESEILIMGDSFTFGHGVNGPEIFSNVLSKKCIQPYNASYQNGFSPEHYEYFFRKNKFLRPKIVLVNLFIYNDLYSDLIETEVNNDYIKILGRNVSSKGNLSRPYNKDSYLTKTIFWFANRSSIGNVLLKLINKKTTLLGDFPMPNRKIPNDLALNGKINTQFKLRTLKALQKLHFEMLKRNKESQLIVSFIPDSETDLSWERMTRTSTKISRDFAKDLNNIQIINSINYLNKEGFYPIDRHFNAIGHKQYGDMLVKKISSISPELCKS